MHVVFETQRYIIFLILLIVMLLTKYLEFKKKKIYQSPEFILNLLQPNVIDQINFGPLQELLAQTLTGRNPHSSGTVASPSIEKQYLIIYLPSQIVLGKCNFKSLKNKSSILLPPVINRNGAKY